MSASNEFSQLQKLLKLKRHEQPAHGYFIHFSDKVMARIEAESPVSRSSWWQWLWASLDTKPLVACGYTCMAAGLLVIGFGVSRSIESDEPTGSALVRPWYAASPTASQSFALDHSSSTALALDRSDAASSVTPVISSSAPGFLFDVSRVGREPGLQPKPELTSYHFR